MSEHEPLLQARFASGEATLGWETAVSCGRELLGPNPDKTGTVRLWGPLAPRQALALVQGARMLAREYPEDVVDLEPGDRVEPPEGEIVLVVGVARGAVTVATRLGPEDTREALSRLERYLTRLVRLDTP